MNTKCKNCLEPCLKAYDNECFSGTGKAAGEQKGDQTALPGVKATGQVNDLQPDFFHRSLGQIRNLFS
ncbi:MAG: hypothetical protein P4L50_01870 [Anaerolineaceae bacterium]|nr:hypothetical protein [Anaerolineaceae bacterium]